MPETALELALPPDEAGRLFRHAAIAATPRRSALAESIFASADGALERAGLAVIVERRRSRAAQRLVRAMPEDEAIWLPGAPMPVLAETLLPDRFPDLDALAAHAGLPTGARAEGLAELSGSTRAAEAGGVRITLLSARLRGLAAEKPIARVTLAGPQDAVFALARRLATDLPLSIPVTSLAEEARALARDGRPRPLRDGAPRIPPGATTAEAFAAVVSHLAIALLAHAPAAHAGETEAGVHQMRVALRRLRSALSLFKTIAGEHAATVAAGLKALAARLGPARDWDVFLAGRLAEVAAAFREDDRLASLRRDAEAARAEAYAGLRAALDDPGFRLLALDLAALARARLPADEPSEEFAARALSRRLKRVLRHGEDISGLPAPELHRLRLDAKRLRYAGEMFGPLWGERKVRRFLRALAAVQEELGHLNDIAVAASLLSKLDRPEPGRAFAIGVVEGWIAAKADGAREAAFEAWERFLGRDLFWDD